MGVESHGDVQTPDTLLIKLELKNLMLSFISDDFGTLAGLPGVLVVSMSMSRIQGKMRMIDSRYFPTHVRTEAKALV
ncbi:hypothetical protein BG842_13985 [Haladaptatus sp. W1]|nr:hypothetical protein BG842_13985 [Haladaptatus sp. W1]